MGNTLVSWQIHCGDVAGALAAADVVIEGEYRSQHVEHAYLEPEAGVGWLENGVLTLRVSTQVIEHAAMIAHILGLPQSKVRVIAAYMGGGFGGKEDMTVEPYLALLVWHTRRPVRMIWDRQESLVASTKRHPFIMRYRTGADRDGTITAQQVEILGDAGAYPNLSPRVLFAAAACACGPYRVPNASITSTAVFTNNVPASAFRGFGAMQIVLGYESQLDELAARLGLSRTELRERNFLVKGDLLPTGERLDTCVEVAQTMHRALALLGEPPRPSGPGKLTGRGIGCNRHPYGRTIWFRDRASAWLSLQADGTLLIRSGVTDLGAGQAASLCQIAAEVLGAPLDDISIYIGDSALNPPAGGTFATRQLYMSGNAVLHAARELRDRMAPVAADLLGAAADDLEFADGRVRPTTSRGRASRWPSWPPPATSGPSAPRTCRPGGPRPARSTRAPGRATRSPTTPTARTPPTWRSTSRPGRSRCCATRPATTWAGPSTRCGSRGRSRAGPCRAWATRSPRTWPSRTATCRRPCSPTT